MQNHYDTSVWLSCRSWNGVQRTIWYGKSLAPSRCDNAAIMIVLLCMHRLHMILSRTNTNTLDTKSSTKYWAFLVRMQCRYFQVLHVLITCMHTSKHFTAFVLSAVQPESQKAKSVSSTSGRRWKHFCEVFQSWCNHIIYHGSGFDMPDNV